MEALEGREGGRGTIKGAVEKGIFFHCPLFIYIPSVALSIRNSTQLKLSRMSSASLLQKGTFFFPSLSHQVPQLLPPVRDARLAPVVHGDSCGGLSVSSVLNNNNEKKKPLEKHNNDFLKRS